MVANLISPAAKILALEIKAQIGITEVVVLGVGKILEH